MSRAYFDLVRGLPKLIGKMPPREAGLKLQGLTASFHYLLSGFL